LWKLIERLIVVCALMAIPPALPALAQDIFTGEPIAEIRVEGNQRIEAETVLSYMQLSPGDRFEAARIDRALKNLFSSGLFADVSFRREGNDLVVAVVENPIINRLAFEGNDRIGDDELQNEVQLRPRVVYTDTKVQADAKRILDIYRRSGRFAATVEPKVIRLDQNRVDLVFEIHEGDITEVRRIDFVGNKVFSDSELRGEILTKESAWYRFLSSNDTYDPDRLTVDREALRNFYLKEGYADFRVVSSIAELSPDRNAFFITFTVEEGERYVFGAIDVRTTLKDLEPESLRGDISTIEGDWYDAEEVESTVNRLGDKVGDLGYAFVEVRPQPQKDRESKTIALTYDIQEGPRVYVERIDISGNVRTLDEVIRREFRIVEGDAFNASKIRRTRQRIQNLGFFSQVDLQTVQGSSPDRTVVEVNVEEQSTGELSFGAGFSTTDGPVGNVGLRERNLLGRGQDLRLDFVISGSRSQLNFSFTEPYFLDQELTAGIDAYRTESDRTSNTTFKERNLGGGFRFGWDWSELLRQNVRYNLSNDEIFDVKATSSEVIRAQDGAAISSVLSQEIAYDRRDNRLNPTDGYLIRLQNDAAGLGGDTRYLRTRLSASYYRPIGDDLVASVSGEAGYIVGLDQNIRVTDMFFLGGATLRGFESRGVGPRDLETGDFLGGKKYASGTVQLSFPLGLPEEYRIRGRAFSDFGTLFDTEFSNVDTDGDGVTIADKSSIRASVGAGLTWDSPFGPFAFDLAYPIIKENFDKEEFFRFSVGTRF
jgi:outer membrane protein insertion porin family